MRGVSDSLQVLIESKCDMMPDVMVSQRGGITYISIDRSYKKFYSHTNVMYYPPLHAHRIYLDSAILDAIANEYVKRGYRL